MFTFDIFPWTWHVPQSSQFSLSNVFGNCSLLGTDNDHRPKYATIILSQMEAVMFISFKYVLTHLQLWKLGNITSPVLAGEYSVMCHIVSGGRLSPSTNYVAHNLTNLAHAKMLESWIISLDISPWTLSFHRSSQFSLSLALEKCLFFGTDNVGRQLSKHLCFAPNGIYCLCILCFAQTKIFLT